MQLLDGQLFLSAGDLVGFSECRHLTHLERERAHGRFRGHLARDETADLVARKGEEHERAHLERLRQAGLEVEEIELDRGSADGLGAAAEGTLDAMRRGVDVIYQGVVLSAPWRGYADFLVARGGPLGARALELRGGRHEARAPRQALLHGPALRLLGDAGRRPGPPPRVDAAHPRRRVGGASPRRRLRALRAAAHGALLRGARGGPRGDVPRSGRRTAASAASGTTATACGPTTTT